MSALQSSATMFRRPLQALVIGTCLAVLPLAHAQESGDSATSESVATVNGKPVSRALVTAVTQQMQQGNQALDEAMVIDELINIELLAQLAAAQGLDKLADIATVLELQRKQTLANAYMRSRSEEIDVDEAELRAAYDKQAAVMQNAEYRASHILVESEAEAVALIERLDNGEDFAALAKAASTGPSASNGGDLGWFQDGAMVAPFMDAVKQLDADAYTASPVNTQFGWHIIKLDNTRSTPVPAFEQVSDQIRQALLRDKLTAHLQQLREDAEITID